MEINWKYVFIIFIIFLVVLLIVLSKIPVEDYSTGTSDEQGCYLSCENSLYEYYPDDGRGYNQCVCNVSLLGKIRNWIFNK